MAERLDSETVAIVSEKPLAREGLRRILTDEGFEMVGSFRDCESLMATDGSSHVDLIILDNHPLEAIRPLRLHFMSSHIVLLSDNFNLQDMMEAFDNGVDGYILREIDCAPLVGSLKLIALGEKVMPSELIDHLPKRSSALTNHACGQQAEVVASLSERERETLRCLVLGHSNKVIARQLDISEATVKVHVKAVLRKLMVQNRTQAAIWAVNSGLEPAYLGGSNDEPNFNPSEEPNVCRHAVG